MLEPCPTASVHKAALADWLRYRLTNPLHATALHFHAYSGGAAYQRVQLMLQHISTLPHAAMAAAHHWGLGHISTTKSLMLQKRAALWGKVGASCVQGHTLALAAVGLLTQCGSGATLWLHFQRKHFPIVPLMDIHDEDEQSSTNLYFQSSQDCPPSDMFGLSQFGQSTAHGFRNDATYQPSHKTGFSIHSAQAQTQQASFGRIDVPAPYNVRVAFLSRIYLS